MGTNFYLNKRPRRSYENHIGKRSAAGWYCWDCHLTLCKGGEEGIHFSKREWNEACPGCGKKPVKEDWNSSSVGRELGFNKSAPKAKKGVSSCSSFSWAMIEADLAGFLKRARKKKPIIDEYGRELSERQFYDILKECPVRYHHSIGQEFS